MKKIKKTVLLALYFLSPLVSITVFLVSSTSLLTVEIPPLRYFSAITGLSAYVWLTYSFILMARPKFLDKAFGMDAILKFHKKMAIVSLALSFAHGLVLFSIFSAQTHDKWAFRSGALSFASLLLLMVLSALFLMESRFNRIRQKFGKNYTLHLSIHNITLLATTILLAHLMLSNSTTYSTTLRAIYLIHYFTAFFFWFYHKVIRSIRIKHHPYKITEIIKQNDEVWTLKCASNNGKKIIDYKPGQYCHLTITSLGKESHPFSFTSSPLEKDHLTFGIKSVGDYTSMISKVNVGDIAYIDGPYGTFNHFGKNGEELVFIAGGIGITPYLSMLRYIKEADRERKISLIWGIKTQNDMIFKTELEELKKDLPNLSVVHILSEDDSWTEDCGFIDREMLDKYGSCEDREEQNKSYFVCGPKPMTNLVLRTLNDMEVSNSNIHYEQFSF